MNTRGYGQFCPVAKASEVVAERWTPLVLREMLMGGVRFNDIHRGVPLMSTSLLSRRLKELQWAGLVERRELDDGGGHGYYLTDAGEALRPIIIALGEWGHQFVRSNFERQDLDPSLLMWDIRRKINVQHLPASMVVIRFDFTGETGARRSWWLLKEEDATEIDLCLEDPGYDVDLTITADLRALTRVWLGDLDMDVAIRTGAITLAGSSALRLGFRDWFSLSTFAHIKPAGSSV
ncbi:MAG: winged helix-turn-helix transcriptional regulator [Chloroflexota bacterium]